MKNGQFKKERKWKEVYNYKRYWLVILLKKLISFTYKILKVLEKSNDKLVLSKQTIERYLKKNGYTHDMPLVKHELTQKQKKGRLKFWKEYIDHNFSQNVFIDETLFRVGKSKQKMEKNRGKGWNFI